MIKNKNGSDVVKQFKPISMANWRQSYKKWVYIRKAIKNKWLLRWELYHYPLKNQRGKIGNVFINVPCGFCKTYLLKETEKGCRDICPLDILNGGKCLNFSFIIDSLQDYDRGKAIKLCDELIANILECKPKKRGVSFSITKKTKRYWRSRKTNR